MKRLYLVAAVFVLTLGVTALAQDAANQATPTPAPLNQEAMCQQEVAYTTALNISLANCQEAIAMRANGGNQNNIDKLFRQYTLANKLVDTVGANGAPNWSKQANDYCKTLARFAFNGNQRHEADTNHVGTTQDKVSKNTYLQVMCINRAMQDALNAVATQHAQPVANQSSTVDAIKAIVDNTRNEISKIKAELAKVDRTTTASGSSQFNQLVLSAEAWLNQMNTTTSQQ